MFRARTRRVSLHALERLLLVVASVHLVAYPWALGGMHLWSQWPSLVLSALALGVALWPRVYTDEDGGENVFKLVMWPKLLRFPIFWVGLVLLAYIACQGFNPAWKFNQNERGAWWMTAIDHLRWLPSGVDVPLQRGGQWRSLIVYASIWMTLCALWVGITRRRSLQILFTAIAANGIALALFGLLQRLLGNGKIYWFYESSNPSFFSSFIYKNHAGAYLNLTLATACGLSGWYYLRGLRRMEKSNPAGIFAFFATFIAINVLISYSRGATMVMLLFLAGAIIAFLVHQFTAPSALRRPIVMITLVLLFGYFLKTGLDALNTGEAWSRFRHAFTANDISARSREVANMASLDMLKDYWVKGVGGNSFRFIYSIYQQHYPEIYGQGGKMQMWWEYAHNDILQFPIEFGVFGLLAPLFAVGWLLVRLLRHFFWDNPLSLCLMYGLALSLSHAWFEFIFQNPPTLLTACVLFAGAVQFAEFEETATRG